METITVFPSIIRRWRGTVKVCAGFDDDSTKYGTDFLGRLKTKTKEFAFV